MTRIVVLAALIAAALFFTDLRDKAGRALYGAGLPRVASVVLGGPVWKGAALYESGRYKEAAAAFRAADFSGKDYDLGTALARTGQFRDAADAFDAALVIDPNDEDARFNLAIVESLMKRTRSNGPDAQNSANARATENKRSNTGADETESDVNSSGDGAAGDRDSGNDASGAGPSKVTQVGKSQTASGKSGKATGSVGSGEGASRTGDANRNVAKPPEQLAHRLAPMSLKTMAASQRWLETLPDDPGLYLKRRIEHERDGRKDRGVAAPEMTDRW